MKGGRSHASVSGYSILNGGDCNETRSLERTSLWHSARAIFLASTGWASAADRHLGRPFWRQNDQPEIRSVNG